IAGGMGEAADHERGREGPWLGGDVADIVDFDAHFLPHLAPHGGFYRLALVHVAGDAGKTVTGRAGAAAEETAVLAPDDHDHDGIGAGEVAGAAAGACAVRAPFLWFRRDAADGTKGMPLVPVEK